MTDALARLTSALSDRYTIERELGRGGMATVYLDEDLKRHRKVAIKVLRPELAAALGAERFHREIEIAANLNHPHILLLLDSGTAEEQPTANPGRSPPERDSTSRGHYTHPRDSTSTMPPGPRPIGGTAHSS
jgi:serine/threonine protein kinase